MKMEIRQILLINKWLQVVAFILLLCLGWIIVSLSMNRDRFEAVRKDTTDLLKPVSMERPRDYPEGLTTYEPLMSGRIFRYPSGLFETSSDRGPVGIVRETTPAIERQALPITFSLDGIIWSGQEPGRALITVSSQKESCLVKEGDLVADFRVNSINKDSVVLSKGREEIVLPLRYRQ